MGQRVQERRALRCEIVRPTRPPRGVAPALVAIAAFVVVSATAVLMQAQNSSARPYEKQRPARVDLDADIAAAAGSPEL